MKKKKEKFKDVEVDLNKETLLKLSLQAHDRGITLNEWCNILLKEAMKQENKND